MKRRLANIVSVLLVLAMTFSLGACGFGSGDKNDDIDADNIEYKGTITVWWPGSEDEQAVIKEAKKDYEALHKDVDVKIISMNTADAYNSYLYGYSGGTVADVAYMDHVYIPALASFGYLANLTSVGYESLKDTFVSTLWSPNVYNNKLYALPMSANVLATAYNKTLIAQVQNTTTDNIALPENYDEYLDLLQKISALSSGSNTKYGITIPAGNDYKSMAAMYYLAAIDRAGGEGIISADGTTSLMNSQASKDAATKIYEMSKYAPPTFSESQFEAGNVGFIEIGSWKMANYAAKSEANGWELGYTTAIPFTEGGSSATVMGMFSLVVSNKSSNAALAADFVKFVTTSDKYQLAFAKKQNVMPTTKTAIEDDYFKTDDWAPFVAQLQNVIARPSTNAWSDIEGHLGTYMSAIMNGTYKSLDDVLTEGTGYHNKIQANIDENA